MQETIKVKTNKIQQIKREAAERINDICPAWKQSNLKGGAVELIANKSVNGELTQSEQSEWSNMIQIWQAVKQIRLDSDTAENTVNGLNTVEEIEAFSW